MAINISLYQMSEPENQFPKTIPQTPVSQHTITLKDGCDIDKPTITFSAGSAIMATLNYAYIDAFQRFYWIRSRNMLHNGICEMELESDPLQSFATAIKDCPATIERNEYDANAYIQDSEYTALSYEAIATREFPNALDDFSYILMTVG